MILIGQYDSPFVRRVGIALSNYGFAFEHRPWSVFGDAERVRAVNPLMRVPVLVLDDGLSLTDSHMILDYLDGQVDQPLFPREGRARAVALRRATLACGAAEKAVSLFYEQRLHTVTSAQWEARCQLQIGSVLEALEAEATDTPYWEAEMGHADIALTCALRFIDEAHPGLFDAQTFPKLRKRARAMEAMAVFQTIAQPFIAPA
jgi:glutathione S-transferase